MELIYSLRRPRVLQGRPPLLVLLHGVRGNELGMQAVAEAMDPRFLALSIRGPHQSGPEAFRWFDVKFTTRRLLIDSAEAEASRCAVLQFIFAALGLMLGYREYDAAHELSAAMLLDAQLFLSTQLDRLSGNIGATVAH